MSTSGKEHNVFDVDEYMKKATRDLRDCPKAVGVFLRINEVMEINIKHHTAKLNFSLGLMHRIQPESSSESPTPCPPNSGKAVGGGERVGSSLLVRNASLVRNESRSDQERRNKLEIVYPNLVGIYEKVGVTYYEDIVSEDNKVAWKYSYRTMIGKFRIYPSASKRLSSYPFDSHDVFITGNLSYHNKNIRNARFVEMTGVGKEIKWSNEIASWLKSAVEYGRTTNGYIRSFEAEEDEWDILSQKKLLTWTENNEPRFQLGFRINRKVKNGFQMFVLSNFLVTYTIFIVVFTTFGIAVGEPGASADELVILDVSVAVIGRLQVLVTVMLALNTLRYSLASEEASAGTSSLLILYLNIAIFSCLLLMVVFGCYTSFQLALAAYDEFIFYSSLNAWHLVCAGFFGVIGLLYNSQASSDKTEHFVKINPTKSSDRELMTSSKYEKASSEALAMDCNDYYPTPKKDEVADEKKGEDIYDAANNNEIYNLSVLCKEWAGNAIIDKFKSVCISFYPQNTGLMHFSPTNSYLYTKRFVVSIRTKTKPHF